jgi:xanthine/CO dehydrogenase XdhC/CoxF family maturation factor
MTHKLDTDIAYLQVLRDVPVAYLGAIGSRTRAAKLYEATGLAPPRLRAPAGLDVGSETPEEIALAIAAEIVAVSTGHGGGALSAIGSPIH